LPPPGSRPGALSNASFGDATAPPPPSLLLRALLFGGGAAGGAAPGGSAPTGAGATTAALLQLPPAAALSAFAVAGVPTEVRVLPRDPSGRPLASLAPTFAALHLDSVHGPDVVPVAVPSEELWAVALAPVGEGGGGEEGGALGATPAARALTRTLRAAAAGVLRGYARSAAARGGPSCVAALVGGAAEGASTRGFDAAPPPRPPARSSGNLSVPAPPLMGEAGVGSGVGIFGIFGDAVGRVTRPRGGGLGTEESTGWSRRGRVGIRAPTAGAKRSEASLGFGSSGGGLDGAGLGGGSAGESGEGRRRIEGSG
jgi:hypothetical protein